MASHQRPSMSVLEFFGLIGGILLTSKSSCRAAHVDADLLSAFKTIGTVVVAIVLRKYPGWGIPMISTVATLRNKDLNLTFKQLRKILPPTGEAIKGYCKSHRLTHEAVAVDCGPNVPNATLHYVDCHPSDVGATLFYVHGGGFCFPIVGRGHMSFAVNSARAAHAPKLVLLEYTLGPELKYPGYLIQTVAALRVLLKTTPASSILVGGDSAGANMLLGMLAHVITPHPSVPPLELTEDLRGALLISPWAKFDCAAESYARNEKLDYVSEEILRPLVTMAQPKAGEVWAETVRGDADFWRKKPVKRMLFTAGAKEVFLDDATDAALRLGATRGDLNAPVSLYVAENEVHVHAILEAGVRDDKILRFLHLTGKQGKSATEVYGWLGRL